MNIPIWIKSEYVTHIASPSFLSSEGLLEPSEIQEGKSRLALWLFRSDNIAQFPTSGKGIPQITYAFIPLFLPILDAFSHHPINIPLCKFMPYMGLAHAHMHFWLFLHTIMGSTFPECVILWLSVRQTDTIDFWPGRVFRKFPSPTKTNLFPIQKISYYSMAHISPFLPKSTALAAYFSSESFPAVNFPSFGLWPFL